MAVHLYTDRQRILLIDGDAHKQNLRASILRNYEIEVDAAGDIGEATSLWKGNSYDLVLLAAPEHSEEALLLSAQIRAARPRQRIALLVGPPVYVQELGVGRKKTAPAFKPEETHLIYQPMSDPAPPQWQETIRRLATDWYAEGSGQA